ncbi:MAG: DUF4276 family protein [Chthoniobacteraceae bacterium]
MIRIGVGVEGPSDFPFWTKVLPRAFASRGVIFGISAMHGRGKLVRGAEDLLGAFGAARCDAVFFLLDKDKDPCMTAIYEEFAEDFRVRLRGRMGKPSCHLCIADRELESWFLAEENAMRELLENPAYCAPQPDAAVGGKGKLERLLSERGRAGIAFNEIAFAKEIAARFAPLIARQHSTSFDYFWSKLESVIASAGETVE